MQTDNAVEQSFAVAPASRQNGATLPWHAIALAIALGALWFQLCRALSSEWAVNEQYNYGWFVPFFAAYLFWLRWQDRPGKGGMRNAECAMRNAKREIPRFAIRTSHFALAATLMVVALFLLLPLRLFEIGNPDWRPLGWLHASAVVAVTLTFIWWIGGSGWLRHFAFPVAFIFVAVPWVTPIEEPIVQGLMRTIAAAAAETVSLFGVPAQVEGNLIRIPNGVLGVNEACSGVRSLQTSLMIGLLFGELKRLTVGCRLALVGAAVGIALVANFARTLFLVTVAVGENFAAVQEWHDLAGYAIVALVFAGTMAIASAIAKGEIRNSKLGNTDALVSPLKPLTSDFRRPIFGLSFRLSTFSFLLFFWLLTVEVGAQGWYRLHDPKVVEHRRWTVRWPTAAPGFRNIEMDERVRGILRFDEGRAAAWRISNAAPGEATPKVRPVQASTAFLYFFRWQPGGTSILRARSHRPEICLPSSGWNPAGEHGVTSYSFGDGFTLPFRHLSFSRDADENGRTLVAHTFFCLREARVAPENEETDTTNAGPTSDWSVRDRIHVVRRGLRNPGQQVMEFVILSSSPVNAAQAKSEFQRVVREIVTVVTK